MRVLYPNGRLTAIRAHQQGRLIISWGYLDDAEHLRSVASSYGWPMPKSGLTRWLIDMACHRTWRWPSARLKEAFLAKMFEKDENFTLGARLIDLYVPDSWTEERI